ncbi:MAG: PIN domain-containing protein [Anaerolineae bacterium]
MKKIVFPDVSILLHFSPLDEIDLPQLCHCTAVEVMFTLVVTEEMLRYQWDPPVPELRPRAKACIQRIEQWLESRSDIGPDTTASFFGKRPDSETMETYHLNWQDQDDILLGTLLEYKQAWTDAAVILLTGDSGLMARASALGIEAITLSGEYRLTETQHPPPTEKQTLRQEMAGFRYRASSLSLSFAGGQDEAVVTIVPQLTALTARMQAQLVAVADEMRHEADQRRVEDAVEVAFDDLDPDVLAALAAQAASASGHSLLDRVAEEESARYRHEVEAYPQKFERYLRRCLEMINEHRRTIRLDLELENAGGATAENVRLLLTVPEHLQWYWQLNESDMPAPPAPPTPPGPEDQVLEKGFHIGGVSLLPSHLLNRGYITSEVPSGAVPAISEAGTQLRWELGTYRHHQSRQLGPLYVRFRRASDIANFAIAWEIQEKGSPEAVRGRLQVLLETTMSTGKAED